MFQEIRDIYLYVCVLFQCSCHCHVSKYVSIHDVWEWSYGEPFAVFIRNKILLNLTRGKFRATKCYL